MKPKGPLWKYIDNIFKEKFSETGYHDKHKYNSHLNGGWGGKAWDRNLHGPMNLDLVLHNSSRTGNKAMQT